MTKPLTVEQYKDLIHTGELKDPLLFLESLMTGQDPRRLSSIYELICEIDSFTDGDISKDDWAEIVDHVTSRFKYHVVTVTESLTAARTLAEYIHPKKKHIEMNSTSSGAEAKLPALTEEEIELFKERFNDEF